MLAQCKISALDIWSAQKIFKSFLSNHISKASILFRNNFERGFLLHTTILAIYSQYLIILSLRFKSTLRSRYLLNLTKVFLAIATLALTSLSLSHLSLSVELDTWNCLLFQLIDYSTRDLHFQWACLLTIISLVLFTFMLRSFFPYYVDGVQQCL